MPTALFCVSCHEALDPPAQRRCRTCSTRRRPVLIAAAITASLAAGGTAVVVTRDAPAAPAPGAPTIPAPTMTLPETRSIEACDPSGILETVRSYNRARRFREAALAGTIYQANCRVSHGLDWSLYYAHEQLAQWPEAERVTNRLVAGVPDDTDFLWWRGKARRHQGKHVAAVFDLRQSLTDVDQHSNGIQIDHLAASGVASGQGCEAAFALRWLAARGVKLRDEARRQRRELYLAHGCAKLDGKGAFAWNPDPDRLTAIRGAIGGRDARLAVDRGLGSSLISRRFATELGITGDAPVDVRGPTGHVTGAPATVDLRVGGGQARAVSVAIVDELPEGLDGVIGLDFLWRFEVTPDRDRFRASTPRP